MVKTHVYLELNVSNNILQIDSIALIVYYQCVIMLTICYEVVA